MMMDKSAESDLEQRLSSRLLDVLIRAALIAILAILCYRIFAPFLTLMVWGVILAVTMYPLHQRLARRLGGKQGRASTLLILLCALVIVLPTALLMNSFGDSIRGFIEAVRSNTLSVPVPRESVKTWPVVGPRVYAYWSQAHSDLPGLVQNLQPKGGELARK